MIIPEEVQCPVHDHVRPMLRQRLVLRARLACHHWRAYHEITGAGAYHPPCATVAGNDSTLVGRSLRRLAAVEAAAFRCTHDAHGQVPTPALAPRALRTPRTRSDTRRHPRLARGEVHTYFQRWTTRARPLSAGRKRSSGSGLTPGLLASISRHSRFLVLVRLHDPLHQRMAHHIASGEVRERHAFDTAQDIDHVLQSGSTTGGQIGLRDIAGHHCLDPKPMRVRNIFICSAVVFCASSRMTNASLSDRPRMNASGATSMTRALDEPRHAIEPEHLVERVVHRA